MSSSAIRSCKRVTGPEGDKKRFWRRTRLPWGSTVGGEKDEMELTRLSDRAMSVASTVRNRWAGVVSDKASYPCPQAVPRAYNVISVKSAANSHV